MERGPLFSTVWWTRRSTPPTTHPHSAGEAMFEAAVLGAVGRLCLGGSPSRQKVANSNHTLLIEINNQSGGQVAFMTGAYRRPTVRKKTPPRARVTGVV